MERRRKATTCSLIQSSHKLKVQTPMRVDPLNLRHRHVTNSALTVFTISPSIVRGLYCSRCSTALQSTPPCFRSCHRSSDIPKFRSCYCNSITRPQSLSFSQWHSENRRCHALHIESYYYNTFKTTADVRLGDDSMHTRL
jgi:hypothetical protein